MLYNRVLGDGAVRLGLPGSTLRFSLYASNLQPTDLTLSHATTGRTEEGPFK